MKRDKYPHLSWYIDSARTVAGLQLALCAVAGISPIIIAAATGQGDPLAVSLASAFTIPFGLCVGYILYKLSMAGADFLCVFRDIEANTSMKTEPHVTLPDRESIGSLDELDDSAPSPRKPKPLPNFAKLKTPGGTR
jgi:hypothetical protein